MIGASLVASVAAQTAPATAPAANPTPAKPMSVYVAVNSLSENRSSPGTGSVSLNLSIFTQGVGPYAAVRRITVTQAVDDQDRPIPASAYFGMSYSGRIAPRAPTANPVLDGNASISSPARSAKAIKLLEGTVELLLPSEANGSLVRVPNISSHLGRVEHPVLAANNIELRFFDQAGWNEFKVQTSYAAETNVPAEATVYLWIVDPSSLVVASELQDGNGNAISNRGTSGSRNNNQSLQRITLGTALTPDMQVAVQLALPAALVSLPFKVQNIPLP